MVDCPVTCGDPDVPHRGISTGRVGVQGGRSERSFRGIPDPVKVASQLIVRPLGIEGADEGGGERAVLHNRHDRVAGNWRSKYSLAY